MFIEDRESRPCDHFSLAGLFTGLALLDELSSRLEDELERGSISHVLVKKFGGWQADELPVLVPVRRGVQPGGWEDLTKLMCEKHGAKGVRLVGVIILKTTDKQAGESMGDHET